MPLGDMTASVNLEDSCAFGHLADRGIHIDILTQDRVVTGGIVDSYFPTRTVVAGRGDQPNRILLVR